MFKGITRHMVATEALAAANAPKPKAPPRLQKRSLSPAGISAAVSTLQHAANLRVGVTQLRNTHSEFVQLRALRTITQEGALNKAVLKVVDPRGALSSFIKTTPSLESLDAVPLMKTNQRAVDFVGGLTKALEAETAIVSGWLETAISGVEGMFSGVAAQAAEYTDILKTIVDGIGGASDTVGEMRILGIGANERVELLKAIKEVLDNLAVPSYNVDKADETLSLLSTLIAPLSEKTGIALIDSCVVTDMEKIAEAYVPTEGSLSEKGYTKEAMQQVLSAAGELVGALQALSARGPAIVERLKAIVGEVRAASVETDDPTVAGNAENGEVANVDPGTGESAGDGGTGTTEPSAAAATEEPASEDLDPDAIASPLDAHRCLLQAYLSLLGAVVESAQREIASATAVSDLFMSTPGGTELVEDVEDETSEDEGGEGAGNDEAGTAAGAGSAAGGEGAAT